MTVAPWKLRIVALVIGTQMFAGMALAQCSDAGVCLIGSALPKAGQLISTSYVLGRSDNVDDLTFQTVQLEGVFHFFRRSQLLVVLPWSGTSGPLGNSAGMGDLRVLWSQTLIENGDTTVTVHVGARLATANVNVGGLPQSYQPGLGTNDVILGISYETDPWIFSLGYQVSRGRSRNTLVRLKRGDDLLARAGYKMKVGIFDATAEVLAIKRLQNSSAYNPSASAVGGFVTVVNSDQFQANAQASIAAPVSAKASLLASIALPLLNRAVNVDGLTRTFTVSLGVQYAL